MRLLLENHGALSNTFIVGDVPYAQLTKSNARSFLSMVTLIWKVNLESTRNLIHAAKAQAPYARFIMGSRILVYDADSTRPGREDDASDPKMAYPASKLAAEKELRESGELVGSAILLRVGDKDGHMERLPKFAELQKWHPAKKFSLIHHRDIATVVNLAPTGMIDARVVNIFDEHPLRTTSFSIWWNQRWSRCPRRLRILGPATPMARSTAALALSQRSRLSIRLMRGGAL